MFYFINISRLYYKVKETMDYKEPKTRQENGKGKGAKSKDVFNQKTVRQKMALLALGEMRTTVIKRT
jgi:hypothetical protein